MTKSCEGESMFDIQQSQVIYLMLPDIALYTFLPFVFSIRLYCSIKRRCFTISCCSSVSSLKIFIAGRHLQTCTKSDICTRPNDMQALGCPESPRKPLTFLLYPIQRTCRMHDSASPVQQVVGAFPKTPRFPHNYPGIFKCDLQDPNCRLSETWRPRPGS